VHFNCGSIGATPRLVIDAIASFMRQQEADPYHNEWGGIGAGLEVVREKAAEFLRASKDEVTLTRNTTEGMNLVASGLKLKRGDEILTTNHEHGGGMVCWQYLAKHHGVKMRYMEMPNPVKNKADILERIESHISKRTRVCSFSHIDTITGLQMPMADIAQLTRPKDILLVCDGAQAPGMLNVDVKALGVDAYASSSHKWMLAPKGSGLLYVRKEAQERVQPIMLYSGYGSYSASVGTRNVPQILGHGVAMDFHNAIGRDRIEARCRQLSRLARARLRDISALTLLTPDQEELSSGVVSFALDKAKGDRGLIVKRFWDEHNIILKPAQGTYAYVPAEHVKGPHANYNPIRVSTHIFNSETEVEKMADIMKKMLA
jgi:selenocysteine lyase/cysteine desulfurase